MRERELILIGTVHGDPDGMLPLLHLLRHENPVEVAVEVSPYALSFRQRNSRRLLRLLARRLRRVASASDSSAKRWGRVQAISAQFGFPFEYRASFRYCRDAGAILSCIDLSSLSKHLIQGAWEELIDRKNLEKVCQRNSVNFQRTATREYALAARLLKEKQKARFFVTIQGWNKDVAWERREAFLAAGIERRWSLMEGGRLAYIGGWQHLLCGTEPSTLFERLAYLRPRRLLLAEYFNTMG